MICALAIRIPQNMCPRASYNCSAIVDCDQVRPAKAMRQHIGFHLLFERGEAPALVPCGFWVARARITRRTAHSLRTAQSGWARASRGCTVTTSSSAGVQSTRSPCTNVTLRRPTCPHNPGVIHWKLNMIAHCDRSHAGQRGHSRNQKETETTHTERNWVKTVGGNRGTVPSK